ncbi:MAG: hypothetical protein WDW36_004475 [Sanguina aurantia]
MAVAAPDQSGTPIGLASGTQARPATPSIVSHALQALLALSSRETIKFLHQRGRLLSALVRPSLWLLVFAAGFRDVFGVSVIPPYSTYIEYQVYVVPGLLGIVLLFNGMQSSLAMVYDREMGLMRLLLTAPLPPAPRPRAPAPAPAPAQPASAASKPAAAAAAAAAAAGPSAAPAMAGRRAGGPKPAAAKAAPGVGGPVDRHALHMRPELSESGFEFMELGAARIEGGEGVFRRLKVVESKAVLALAARAKKEQVAKEKAAGR